MSWKHRIQEARVGSPRSGKTYGAEVNALNYLAQGFGAVLVYNKGMPTDWSQFETIRPLTYAEHIKEFYTSTEAKRLYKLDPRIEYFERENGDVHHFRDFTQLFWGKGACIYRQGSKYDDAIFRAVHNYVSCTYFFCDDIASIVKHGLKTYMSQLLSSQNHAGKLCGVPELQGKGVDICLIFHALDAVNTEVWRYITHVTVYNTMYAPKRGFVENPLLDKTLRETWTELRNMPEYTGISYFVRGRELEKEIINPADVQALKEQLC